MADELDTSALPAGRQPAPEPPEELFDGLTGSANRECLRRAWRLGWVAGVGAGHARALRVVEMVMTDELRERSHDV